MEKGVEKWINHEEEHIDQFQWFELLIAFLWSGHLTKKYLYRNTNNVDMLEKDFQEFSLKYNELEIIIVS